MHLGTHSVSIRLLMSPFFDRWLCALLGMIVVGISILCVSKRLHLTGGCGVGVWGLKLLSWVRLTRSHFTTV